MNKKIKCNSINSNDIPEYYLQNIYDLSDDLVEVILDFGIEKNLDKNLLINLLNYTYANVIFQLTQSNENFKLVGIECVKALLNIFKNTYFETENEDH